MANLIIKPTSGGSLILQDEGGTAANTIDASGNTQLAGTLGVTGATTLSGTTNNLGTVTAGSIAGGAITSATTFPAGHVIQMVSTLYEPGGSSASTTSTTFVASGFFVTITPTNAAYDIVMTFHLNGHMHGNAGSNGIVDIQRSINGGSYAQMGGLETYAFAHIYNAHGTTSAFTFTDTNFSAWTTGAIIYKLFWRTENASHAHTLCRANTSNCAWAMEIKR